MKYAKYFLVLVIVAVVVSVTCTKAYNYPTPLALPISVELEPNDVHNTGMRSKTTSTDQYYENQYTYTALNKPCKGCIITAKLHKSDGSIVSDIDVVMGDPKKFDYYSEMGDYYLTIERTGVTIFTTVHNGKWYISKTP